ncbi:MAG: glutamate--tRNA ligase family protein [Acidimicrobiales bacterium]
MPMPAALRHRPNGRLDRARHRGGRRATAAVPGQDPTDRPTSTASRGLIVPSGRFAPSPTGDLHLGNLRTAMVAWLFARSDGATFVLRFEDLDTATVRPEYYQRQADDLAALGLDWDEPVIRQSDRLAIYHDVVDRLVAEGSPIPATARAADPRAAQAPNGPSTHEGYPQTCRHLSHAERSA